VCNHKKPTEMKKTLLTMLALLMMGTTVKPQGAIELP
jgi:hypothetical protein